MSYIPDRVRSFANYYLNGSAITVIPGQNAFVKISGNTTPGSSSSFNISNNRATFIGQVPREFIVTAIFSATINRNNEWVAAKLGINSNTAGRPEIISGVPSKDEPTAIAYKDVVTLMPNDYIEMFVANTTSSRNIRVYNLHVVVEESR